MILYICNTIFIQECVKAVQKNVAHKNLVKYECDISHHFVLFFKMHISVFDICK